MKNQILYFIFLFFICCSNENKKDLINNETKNEIPQFVTKYGNEYFKYDEIEFYHIDFDENNILQLEENKNKSETDKLKFNLIIGDFPEKINQIEFLNSMEKISFIKKEIDKTKFPAINKIFIEKTVSESYDNACIAIYRDILVFKNKGKIIGFAKICFDCEQNIIIGTQYNTENFGQDGDYKNLKIILGQ